MSLVAASRTGQLSPAVHVQSGGAGEAKATGSPEAVATPSEIKEAVTGGTRDAIQTNPDPDAPGNVAAALPREADATSVPLPADGEIGDTKQTLLKLERLLCGTDTPPAEFKHALSQLMRMRPPAELRDEQDKTAAAVMNRLPAMAMVAATRGMNVFSGDGLKLATRATSEFSRLVGALDALTSGDDAAAVRAVMTEISQAMQGLTDIARAGDKEKLRAVADCLRLVGESRVAGLAALAKNRQAIESGLEGAGTAAVSPNAAATAKMCAAADGLRQVADALVLPGETAAPAMARLPEAERLAGNFVDAVQAMTDGLAESLLLDNPLAPTLAGDLASIASSGTDAVEKLCGLDESLRLAGVGERADRMRSTLEKNIETATAYTASLDQFIGRLAQGQLDSLAAAMAAAAKPPDGDIPAAMRRKMEGKIEALTQKIEALRDVFEAQQKARIDTLLSGGFEAGLEEIAGILGHPLVSGDLKTWVAEKVASSLRSRNEAALQEILDLASSIAKLVSDPDAHTSSGQRDAIATKLDSLSSQVAAQLSRLDAEKAALAADGARKTVLGDQAGAVAAALDGVAAKIMSTKEKELADARSALTLLRFAYSTGHKLSPDVVYSKGLPGLAAILDRFTLPEAERNALLAKLATSGELSPAERLTLHEQLSNAMTTRQKGNDPMKTALDRLDSGAALSDRDLAALRRGGVFILSSEEAVGFKAKTEAESKTNLEAMNKMADALDIRCRTLASKTAALINFGREAAGLLREAESVLLPAEFAEFEKKIDAVRSEHIPEMIALCAARAGQAGAADKAALETLLVDTDCGIGFCSLALGKGAVGALLSPENGEAAIDELALHRPDLDETCLLLKMNTILRGASPHGEKLRQMTKRHESGRLARACQSLLAGQSVTKKAAAERDRLVALKPNEFIDAFLATPGLGHDFDLFVIQAAWLRRAASLPGPATSKDFNAFQRELPDEYKSMTNLESRLQSGLLSTTLSNKLDSFLDAESSLFNRSGFRHQVLSLLGLATGGVLTYSDRVDKMLADIALPENHAAANRVANRVMCDAIDIGRGASLAADATNLKLMLTRGGNADLSVLDHVKSLFGKGPEFGSVNGQIRHAAKHVNNAAPGAGPTNAGSPGNDEKLENLTKRFQPVLENIVWEMRGGSIGKSSSTEEQSIGELFINGSALAAKVLAIDAVIGNKIPSLKDAGWEERKKHLKDINPGNADKINLLSMKVWQNRHLTVTPDAKDVTGQFLSALKKAKSAQTLKEFALAEAAMAEIIDRYNLTGRAEATLAFKKESNNSFESKMKGVSDETKKYLNAEYGGLYQEAAGLRNAGPGTAGRRPEECLSSSVAGRLEKMADVMLLTAFASADAAASFGDFVGAVSRREAGSGYDRAVREMAAAMTAAHPEIEEADAQRVAGYFLARAANRYQKGKGGPEAVLKERDASILAYANIGAVTDKRAAAAILAGLRAVNLHASISGLGKGNMLCLDTSLGVSASMEADLPTETVFLEFNLSVAIAHGISLERDKDGKFNLYLSRGLMANVGVGVSALSDNVTAEVSLDGSAVGGYRLDFDNAEKCERFMNAMLRGERANLRPLVDGVSVVDQYSIALSVSAGAGIGKLVDKAAPVVDAVQYGVTEALLGDRDHRRVVNLEISAEASGGLEFKRERRGADLHSVYTIKGSISAEVNASVGREGEIAEAEASGTAAFVATLDSHYRDGQLVGSTMTRTFEFSDDATEDDVAATLLGFGVENRSAAKYVMERIAAGENVVMHIDAQLSPVGLENCREAGKRGDLAQLWALRDRDNYGNSAVRVETTPRSASARHSIYNRESEDDAEDLLDKVSVEIAATSDGRIRRTQEFRARPMM